MIHCDVPWHTVKYRDYVDYVGMLAPETLTLDLHPSVKVRVVGVVSAPGVKTPSKTQHSGHPFIDMFEHMLKSQNRIKHNGDATCQALLSIHVVSRILNACCGRGSGEIRARSKREYIAGAVQAATLLYCSLFCSSLLCSSLLSSPLHSLILSSLLHHCFLLSSALLIP